MPASPMLAFYMAGLHLHVYKSKDTGLPCPLTAECCQHLKGKQEEVGQDDHCTGIDQQFLDKQAYFFKNPAKQCKIPFIYCDH